MILKLFEPAVERVMSDQGPAVRRRAIWARSPVKLESAMHHGRLAALRANMAALDLDAVAIVPGANFQYLTGGRFSSMERRTILVIPAEGEVRAILPALELLSWERLEFEARVHSWRDSDGYAA